MFRRVLLTFVPIVLGAGALAVLARDDPRPQEPTAEDRLDAARQTFELLAKDAAGGRHRDVDRSYLWSRRILEVQLELAEADGSRVAGYEAHLDRMKDLAKVTETEYRAGVAPQADAVATVFYQLEARSWLAKAKAK